MKPMQRQTFKIESLLDKEGEYVGIFDSKTGLLLRHEGAKAHGEEEPPQEQEDKEIETDKNQLNLF